MGSQNWTFSITIVSGVSRYQQWKGRFTTKFSARFDIQWSIGNFIVIQQLGGLDIWATQLDDQRNFYLENYRRDHSMVLKRDSGMWCHLIYMESVLMMTGICVSLSPVTLVASMYLQTS